MKINIYYGGRGLIEDSTIYVINKITEVLEELRVEVVRYNLYEEKGTIAMLPKTLKEADGVILATNVEWFGIGGLMHQFLDVCWLYGDKEHLKNLYMFPVVISNAYGEDEGALYLSKAWEILGGMSCQGIVSYVEDHVEFETNRVYGEMIEKRAEEIYRTVNKKATLFPTSIGAVHAGFIKGGSNDLTPQESEQLSIYVSDDSYVKKQKEDIEELTEIFKVMLESTSSSGEDEFISVLKSRFTPVKGFRASYVLDVEDGKRSLVIDVNHETLSCYYGEKKDADVYAKAKYDVFNSIVHGRMTFQRAFMSGNLTTKGDFKLLRTFDQLFQTDTF